MMYGDILDSIFDLCVQTVTVYHKTDDEITKTVYDRAFFEFDATRTISKTGSRDVNSFLLIIPGEDVKLHTGDKVILGEGPDISTREEWAQFIPGKVEGLVVIRNADPKYWDGIQTHVESGG